METLGINFGFLFLEALFVSAPIAFSIVSLLNLRKQKISGGTLAIWVLVICAIPFLGALAYWIVRPVGESK